MPLSNNAIAILKQLSRRKIIPFPHGGQARNISISEYRPIIDHPLFMEMKYKKQLGNVYVVFPDASHSRFLHSIDTLSWQKERGKFWAECGMISQEDANCLNVFALLHDIGHGPFSHTLDRICSEDHDARGLKKIAEMSDQIEKCGVPYHRIRGLFDGCDQLHQAVKHHPLGTDKLSYLTLDARHCISGMPEVGRLIQYLFWLDCQIMVHIKCLYDALELKRFYMKMYREVYFRKSCLIGQRIMEKEIYHLLQSGKLTEDALWDLSEEQLAAQICRTKRGRKGYERFRDLASKCVIAFKMPRFAWVENISGKPLAVFPREQRFFQTMEKAATPEVLDRKEKELAKLLGISPLDLDIVPPVATYRFAPPAITIVNGNEAFSDSALPDNAAAVEELASACLVMRVCVSRPLRDRVFAQAKLVDEFVADWQSNG